MNLQGGLGDVTVKNDTVLQDSWEKIAAVKHANGVDVWITVSEINTDKIYCYLLTASGLNTSPIINTIGHPDNYGASCSQFSPSGRKLAIAVNQQGSEIFDFNSATGILSNPVLFPASSLWGDVDAGFSPDETKLYLTRWTGAPPGKLYQVNLTAGDSLNIVNSLILIDTATDDLARIQTGADGRLYVAHYNYNYIAAINTPNALGVNCNFIQNAVYLNGGLSTNGLPSFISSYFYDSSSITTAVPINIPTNTVFAFPNPFNSFTTITLPDDAHATTDKINMILIDILGNKHELKKSITENNSRAQIKIERNNLATGIYLLNIQYNNKSFSQKLVITN
jgi:hypothetical protein